MKEIKKEKEFSFVIVTSNNSKSLEHKNIDGIQYYAVPGGLPVHYKRDTKIAYNEWKEIFEILNQRLFQSEESAEVWVLSSYIFRCENFI